MVDRLVNSEANTRRITLVEQCFGSSGQPLVLPGRVLVGEGVLTKMCRKKPKPRQFFLFNDILVYGNIVISKKKYNKQHIIPLENVKIQSVQDDTEMKNGWQIISPSKSFTVYAATSTEKAEWMAHINKCIQDMLSKHGKNRAQVEDSPVWVPDSDAPVCMHCSKSEFGVLNRRHHCRMCGIVACNSCTNKKWLLPQQSSKPLRVCLSCYDKLQAQMTAAAVDGKPPPVVKPVDSSGEDDSSEEDDVSQPYAATEGVPQPTFYGAVKP